MNSGESRGNTTMETLELDALEGEIVEQNGAAIVRADAVPQFAISLHEARSRFEMMKQFVREQMIENEDFGIIPGCKKPSLWKPGAEKLNTLFGFAVSVTILSKTVDVRGTTIKDDNGKTITIPGFVEYEIQVTLVNKATGTAEAEGVGSCNSREKKYRNSDPADVANTVLKMAKKRALIDATLSATRASGIFTQDVEDMPREAFQQQPQRPQHRPAYADYGPRRTSGGEGNGTNATEAQQKAISAMARKVWPGGNHADCLELYLGCDIDKLTKKEASNVIEAFNAAMEANSEPAQVHIEAAQ